MFKFNKMTLLYHGFFICKLFLKFYLKGGSCMVFKNNFIDNNFENQISSMVIP